MITAFVAKLFWHVVAVLCIATVAWCLGVRGE
jgi:hypothetical protein